MGNFRVSGFAASLRSRADEKALKGIISSCRSCRDLENSIERMSFRKLISNSDACLVASLYGAYTEGVDFEIIRLNKYFSPGYPEKLSEKTRTKMAALLRECHGYIISTPVYFGNSSSYVSSFVRFLTENNLVRDRVIGMDSVGAKRNGGQESSIMLQLYDLVKKGAFVCGNGPITSQYGGTAWAGDLGSIREDTFGLKTSEGVGRKVAQVVKLVNSQETKEESEIRISFWIMQEKNSVMKDTVADIISKASEIIPETFAFDVVDLTSLKIRRCQGCPVCPFYLNQQGEYGVFRDKIQDDDLKDIYDRLINTDGIIICGYNPVSREGVNDIYQIFIERTRQIRRDNFLLTNIPVSAFCLGEPSAGFTFSLKIMTSFLRHNTVILPPIEDFSSHGTVGSETVGKFAKVFLSMASMKQTREKLASNSAVYIPIGYSEG